MRVRAGVAGALGAILVWGVGPCTALALDDMVPCDPATGCIPTPPPSPPATPVPTPAPPSAIPAPVLELPGAVRRVTAIVRKNDADAPTGFTLSVRWAAGTGATSFSLRLEKVSFDALTPGQGPRRARQFSKIKPMPWVETGTYLPKSWRFPLAKETAFYRLQIRGINARGAGPTAEVYLLVAKDNEAPIKIRA